MSTTDICKDITKLTTTMQLAVGELMRAHPIRIVETLRTIERQRMLVATNKSKSLKSRHMFGLAVDIYPLPKGYDTSASDIKKIQDSWVKIATKYGYPNTKFISWDALHISLNNGVSI
jgi:uncharacterized protein YcbK (DUF882 family)